MSDFLWVEKYRPKKINDCILSDDYDVAISKQKISHFVNRNKPIQYWIALEPDSEF